MTIRPVAQRVPVLARSLAVGSALLSVMTFVLACAAGWPLTRALTYAVAVPLAASAGVALLLATALAGAALDFGNRIARGRFALPVSAAAAGCVLASLWLVAPSGTAPLRQQRPATPNRLAAAPPVVEVAPPAPRQPAPPAPDDRTPPSGNTPGVRGPVAAPRAPAVDPPPAVTGQPRVRPGIVRSGLLPDAPAVRPRGYDGEVDGEWTQRKAKAKKVGPGRRCGQRADHCGTPFGRAVGWRSR